MSSKICSVAFSETKEQREELARIIESHKEMKGAIMPVMQKAQEIYGYLPEEVMKRIAEGLSVSEESVYGIATFYSQFTLNPRGKYNFGVCLGTACYVKGAGEILDELKLALSLKEGECSVDGKFSINVTRCIGCCGLAPVITVNEDVFGKLTKEDIPKIVEQYRNKD